MCGHSTSISSLLGDEVYCEYVADLVLANNIPIQDLVTVGNADIAATGDGFSLSTMTEMNNWVALADNLRCAKEILACIDNPANKVNQTVSLNILINRCKLTIERYAPVSIPAVAVAQSSQRELVGAR
jgi:hypothetical protein